MKKAYTADELGEEVRQVLILHVDYGEKLPGLRRDLKLLQFKLSRPDPSTCNLIPNPRAFEAYMKPRLTTEEALQLLNLLNAWRLS